MIDGLAPHGDGHTPVSPEDLDGLIPTFIATQRDLNAAEQQNILEAVTGRSPSTQTLLSDEYLRGLHRSMFKDVWRWAGQYRKRETNLGIDPSQIAEAVRNLVDDVALWVNTDVFSPDESALRFHHRLVAIHPFPNGNGRHGRVSADLLARTLGQPRFSWGSGLDVSTDDLRIRYHEALRAMDVDPENAASLMGFARS